MRAYIPFATLLALFTMPRPVPAQSRAGPAIGTVHFRTSCNAAARPIFNGAVALLHSFAFSPAIERFNAVLRADPGCAMAWWGLALSAWGNPFAPGMKPAAAIQHGLDAVARARSTGSPGSRESRYIEAAAHLYEHADSMEQRARLLAYRDAMAALVAAEPTDTEAAIFHALAVVISADPADKTYAAQLAAGATLERLFAAQPSHPGLAHYIIHCYDVPPLASRALDAAQRYSHIAPALSHALHMPSHTYTRVGEWQESIDANVASARAAKREGAVAEELHAADYRIYAYLQMTRDRAARRLLDSLPSIAARLDPNAVGTGAPPAAGYFAIAAIPARFALERGAWAEAARLELRPSPVPWADAVTWFARGLGAARSGDTVMAQTAIAALAGIRDRLAAVHEGYWSGQVDIQQRGASAWLAFAAGRKEEALAAMRAAAEREDATEKSAITPGPLAPARELLGEMLQAMDQDEAALAAFEKTLQQEPNRFRALAGAATSAGSVGGRARAARYYAALLKLEAHADRPPRPQLVKASRRVKQPT